jgi:tRNA A37 N6-isopentenylltransferase MiaA
MKETLEEAAKEYAKNFAMSVKSARDIGFIEGAKWMEERMYSEEEVLKLLITFSDDRTFLKKDVAVQWFEQFKKQ